MRITRSRPPCAATGRSPLFALVVILWWFLPGCSERPVPPTDGAELRIEIEAPASVELQRRSAEALRLRLKLAGWPWYTVETSGATGLRVRVGELDEHGRSLLEHLLCAPLELEGFVRAEPPGGERSRPVGPPTFRSEDVDYAHLEKARSGTRVHIKLNGPASRRLEQATRQHLGGSMRIFLDGEWLLEPLVHEPMRGGLLRLSLLGDSADAIHLASMELVVGLRGQLPAPLRVVSVAGWRRSDRSP